MLCAECVSPYGFGYGKLSSPLLPDRLRRSGKKGGCSRRKGCIRLVCRECVPENYSRALIALVASS